MKKFKLSKEEFELIQSATDGEIVDFSNRKNARGKIEPITIRAIVIRNLLLDLPLPPRANDSESETICHSITCKGIYIKGAIIDGIIDISDGCGKDGNSCPPLLFEDCIFLGKGNYDEPAERPEPSLNAKHSRLSRLSLKNCKAGYIDLSDCSLDSDLEIEGLQALNDGGQCRINAKSIFIDGSLSLANTHLRLKQKKIVEIETGPHDYALGLGMAEIKGDIRLRPNFIADGGVQISGIQLTGDFWADGAVFTAQQNYALDGQSAFIKGIVGLTSLFDRHPQNENENIIKRKNPPSRFRANGCISFLGAELGSLTLQGALIEHKKDEKNNGFLCESSVIRQAVWMSSRQYFNDLGESIDIFFESNAQVSFFGTKISGSVFANNAVFDSPFEKVGFGGKNMTVEGDLIFSNVSAGYIILEGAKIDGLINLTSAKTKKDSEKLILFCPDVSVGKNVILDKIGESKIYLSNAKISGSLTAFNESESSTYGLKEFYGQNLQISQDLFLTNLQTEIIDLRGAKIDLDLHIYSQNLSDLGAEEIKIGGNLYWSGNLRKRGSFRGSRISGEFVIGREAKDPLTLILEKKSSPKILLEDAIVSRDLKVNSIIVRQIQSLLLNWDDYSLKSIYKKELECYEKWNVYDALFEHKENNTNDLISVTYVMSRIKASIFNKKRVFILLNGLRKSIDEVNGKDSKDLLLNTEGQASDYLKFFCANIWGAEGAFRIVESPSEFAQIVKTNESISKDIRPVTVKKWAAVKQDLENVENNDKNIVEEHNLNKKTEINAADSKKVDTKENLPEEEEIKTSTEVSDDNIKSTGDKNSASKPMPLWFAEAFVCYANGLFKSTFHIYENGHVDMVSDIPFLIPEKFIETEDTKQAVENTENALQTNNIENDIIVNPSENADSSDKNKEDTEVSLPKVHNGVSTIFYISFYRLFKKHQISELKDQPETLLKENNSNEFFPSFELISSWKLLSQRKKNKRRDEIIKAINFKVDKPVVNLRGLKIGSLDDKNGTTWGNNLILELDGFEYERFESSEVANDENSQATTDGLSSLNVFNRTSQLTKQDTLNSALRIKWLEKQFRNKIPVKEEFRPQPYEQVAKCLRGQGEYDFSTDVLIEKLRAYRKSHFSSRFHYKRIGYWLWDYFFGYGVKWTPVFLTSFLFLFIGTFATDILNNGYIRLFPFGKNHSTKILPNINFTPVLVRDSDPVSTIAIFEGSEDSTPVSAAKESATLASDGKFVKEIQCGDEIEPSLYALDTFVPLLDLRQESKCTITSVDNGWNTLWKILKSLYSILGWVVTSVLILTISGVVSRLVERR